MFSSKPFIAVEINQRNGKIDNMDTIIKIECIENDLKIFLITVYIYPFQKLIYLKLKIT